MRPYEIKDIRLAPSGRQKIDWVRCNMPLLRGLEEEFKKTKPFAGIKISLSIHMEAKTAYLCEVLAAGGRDVDRLERHTESLAKQLRIALRPLRRPEARHRVGVDALSVEPEPVERLHADKQRKRTVESARQAEDNILATDRLQPRR